jgi:hypothetical protein
MILRDAVLYAVSDTPVQSILPALLPGPSLRLSETLGLWATTIVRPESEDTRKRSRSKILITLKSRIGEALNRAADICLVNRSCRNNLEFFRVVDHTYVVEERSRGDG